MPTSSRSWSRYDVQGEGGGRGRVGAGGGWGPGEGGGQARVGARARVGDMVAVDRDFHTATFISSVKSREMHFDHKTQVMV